MSYQSRKDRKPKKLPKFMREAVESKLSVVNEILTTDHRAATVSQQAIALAAYNFIIERK